MAEETAAGTEGAAAEPAGKRAEPKLTKEERGTFNGILITCTNNAVNALSETIKKAVNMDMVSSDVMMLKELPDLLDPEDLKSTVVWMKMGGDLKGTVLLNCSLDTIVKLENILLQRNVDYFGAPLSSENVPVIRELATLIADYYMDIFSKLFKVKLGKPSISVDPSKIPTLIGGPAKDTSEALVMKTEFSIPAESIAAKLILVFESSLKGKIMEAVEKNLKKKGAAPLPEGSSQAGEAGKTI